MTKRRRSLKPPKCVFRSGTALRWVPVFNWPGAFMEMFSTMHRPISNAQTRGKLLEIREKLGWSRTFCAAVLGVPSGTLRRWEVGTRLPSAAARRLIWIIHTAMTSPQKLAHGGGLADLLSWGAGPEIEEFQKAFYKHTADPAPDTPASRA